MDITIYEKQFQHIMDGEITKPPYQDENYLNYVKLNNSRLKRWYKIGQIIPELAQEIQEIVSPQEWLFITEPWCGDAAHVQAFIVKLAALNPLVTLSLQNRDTANSEIDKYLTNGGKSIPKLIIRDANGQDLFNWGPRPKAAQAIHLNQLHNELLSTEEKKIELQNWYNKDKGLSFQKEFLNLWQEKIIGANIN